MHHPSSKPSYRSSTDRIERREQRRPAQRGRGAGLLRYAIALAGFALLIGGGPLPARAAASAAAAWSATGSMALDRYGHTMTALADGRVLVTGGVDYSGTPGIDTSAELWTPSSGLWAPGGALLTPRVSHTATLLADGRVLILGGYNPVPQHPMSTLIEQYLGLWDATLAGRFEHDRRVAVVKMADIVCPKRLSRYDNFHPGQAAYQEAAKRIAAMLLEELAA